MKFTVSSSRKVKDGKTYEMMEIFASVESDTAIEPMGEAFERVRDFVESWIEVEADRLLAKSVQRVEGKK